MADLDHRTPASAEAPRRIPRFATCSILDCARPGVRGASCSNCKKHLCARHQSRQFHHCSSAAELDDDAWEKAINDEVSALLSQLDSQALAERASALNGHKPCVFEPGQHLGDGAMMGCANYHAWLVFEDGERWLARIPRTGGFSDMPPELVEYFVASEYATLRFLETTRVPAPKAFGFGLASDPTNRAGVSYLLIEALPGRPFDPYGATPAQTGRVMEQVAEIMGELASHPFPQAGSLLLLDNNDGNTITVGAVASNRSLHLGRTGPFTTAADYFDGTAAHYLDLVTDGQLHPLCAPEAYLFYQLLRSHAASLGSDGESGGGEFFLKHVDDKGDHLLVDDDHNVVGVIDWQFARTVPACEALGPSLLTADMAGLYSRASSTSANDRLLAASLRKLGHEGLARRMEESGEVVRRFQFGIPSGFSQAEARDVLAGLLISLGADPQTLDIDAWIDEKRRELAGSDSGLEVLRKLDALVAAA